MAAAGRSPDISELEHSIGYTTTNSSSLFYHPNERDFLYVSGGNLVVCDFADPHRQTFLRGHDSAIRAVALSPRGDFVATGQGGENSDVVVWGFDSSEGGGWKMLHRFSEHDGAILSLSFSHDGRLLLSVGEDNAIMIWDVQRGLIVSSTHLAQGCEVEATAWGGYVRDIKRRNTESYQFAVAGSGLWVYALNPYTGSITMTMANTNRYHRRYYCLGFTEIFTTSGRSGQRTHVLLAGTSSGDFLAFRLKPQNGRDGSPAAPLAQVLGDATIACGGGVRSLCVVPLAADLIAAQNADGGNASARGTARTFGSAASGEDEPTRIVLGGGDGQVVVFEWEKELEKWIDVKAVRLQGAVQGLSLSPDGAMLVAGTKEGYIFHAAVDRIDKPRPVSVNHCGAVYDVAFAPDSSTTFATCGADGTVRVWDTNDYTVKTKASVSLAGVEPRCLAFSIDAVISGWTDGKVRCHNAHTGEALWTIDDAHRGGVTALALSGNMRFILTGGEEGEVRVWELRNRDLVSHLKEHTKRVTSLSVFEDDVHAMSASRDRSFLCWDLRNEKRISSHTQRMGGINSISLTHDQTLVVTVGQERSVTFWDLRESQHIARVSSPEQGMHTLEATCVAVSNKVGVAAQLFATGGGDKTVKLWTTGIPQGSGADPMPELLSSNPGHSGTVTGIAFSPDDRQMVSVGTDGAVFIWNIYADDEEEAKVPAGDGAPPGGAETKY